MALKWKIYWLIISQETEFLNHWILKYTLIL
jgi:hypothetical protein